MIIGPATLRPMEFAVYLFDRTIVDAGDTAMHEPLGVEFPVLVAVGAIPGSSVVAPFIAETDGNPVVAVRPDFLDQPIIEFTRPFSL